LNVKPAAGFQEGTGFMQSEKRVVVWVQNMGRTYLMLQWHDPATGKRKSRSADTNNPLEAERKRADLEYELNNGLFRESSRMSWAAFRQLFEAEYVASCRPNTRRNCATLFALFERLCNPISLRSITERTVSTFKAALFREPGRKAEGQAPSTVAQRLALLQVALRWAAAQKLIPEVPEFPRVKVPKRRPQPVPAESFEKLLVKAPDAGMRTFLLCGWLAGLRLHEAAALEWEPTDAAPWVDLARDRIVLPADFAKAVEDQQVALDPDLKAALLALPRRGRRVFRFETKRGRPVCLSAVGERVIRLAKKAGVKLTMHTLHKGFLCYHAARVPAQVLQKLARHANIQTTMDYYANVDEAAAAVPAGRNRGRNTAESAGPAKAEASPQPVDSQGR
jgi:integrase